MSGDDYRAGSGLTWERTPTSERLWPGLERHLMSPVQTDVNVFFK